MTHNKFDFNSINEYSTMVTGGDASLGIQYDIKDLAFNLQQTDKPRIKHTRDHFPFYYGNIVKGISPYDSKEHRGMIKHIYNDADGKPKLVYIMDLSTNNVIPVMVDGLKHTK